MTTPGSATAKEASQADRTAAFRTDLRRSVRQMRAELEPLLTDGQIERLERLRERRERLLERLAPDRLPADAPGAEPSGGAPGG